MSAPDTQSKPAQLPRDLLPVRMLNEFTYCPRLFHLEWVQSEFVHNAETLDGARVHGRVDRPSKAGLPTGDEDPPEVVRSVYLSDEQLGLVAKIDLVEASDDGQVVPVDYKRSRAPDVPEGAHEPEIVQVVAQALLLRAHGYECGRAFLYFAGSRRRVEIEITEARVRRIHELRDAALAAAEASTPPPPLVDSPKCPGCSLVGICLPDEHNFVAQEGSSKVRRIVPVAHDALPLHITSQGAVLSKDGAELVVRPQEGEVQRFRMMDVATVQIHGHVKITTPAVRALMTAGIPVSYYSQGSWFYGRSTGHDHKNVMLRIAQFREAASSKSSLALAKRFVRTKIRNCRVLVRRNVTDVPKSVLDELRKYAEACDRATNMASLLGLEGTAARVYFSVFGRMLSSPGSAEFTFEGRNRRPPKDPVNALLSFVYSLLTSSWTTTAGNVGFDPYLGFYHQPKYGRPALALDLMEEFRPIIADSVVITVINTGVVRDSDFERARTGVSLKPAARKRVIAAFERRLEEQVKHPIFRYRMSYRRIFEVQARLLARHLMGEIDVYPEFVTR